MKKKYKLLFSSEYRVIVFNVLSPHNIIDRVHRVVKNHNSGNLILKYGHCHLLPES
jgi:hypothetical protein